MTHFAIRGHRVAHYMCFLVVTWHRSVFRCASNSPGKFLSSHWKVREYSQGNLTLSLSGNPVTKHTSFAVLFELAVFRLEMGPNLARSECTPRAIPFQCNAILGFYFILFSTVLKKLHLIHTPGIILNTLHCRSKSDPQNLHSVSDLPILMLRLPVKTRL